MKNFTLTTLLLSLISLTTWGQCSGIFGVSTDSTNTATFYAGNEGGVFDFGDSTTLTVAANDTITYSYSNAGTYTVFLTTINTPCIDSAQVITVGNNSPPCSADANFTYSTDINGNVTITNTGTDADFDIPALGLLAPIFIPGGADTTFNFQISGTYQVCAYAIDSNSTTACSDQYCDSVDFGTNNNCSANANFSANSFNNDLTYDFYALDSANSCSYFWDFGDGNTATTWSETHTYSVAGTYTVTLTVGTCDSLPCYDTISQVINVIDSSNTNGCNADASFSANSFNNDLTYDFYALDSANSCTYFWDFGDGNTSTNWSENHTYSVAGTYTVTLTVGTCDSLPCYDTISQVINVIDSSNTNGCTAEANFNWFQAYDSINNNWLNAVYIVDYSSGNNLSYNWSFGDGNSSTLQYPSHNYAAIGQYNVCLTVMDDDSCVASYCDSIVVVTKASGFSLQVISQAMVSVEEKEEVNIQNLYPNPTTGNANLVIHSNIFTAVNVNIMDLTGKVINNRLTSINTGENNIDLSTQELTQGIYIISVTNEEGININQRLIKK